MSDKLDGLRAAVRKQLDLEQRIEELDEEGKRLKKTLNNMSMVELPAMFAEAGVDKVGLPAVGNVPPYDASLKPYYHANIPADKANEAFAWLEDNGHGDLIKNVITIELGRGENDMANRVKEFLEDTGIPYNAKLTVPWNTLTAFVKEQIEKYGAIPPLDLLGAIVGQIVKLKERKS